MNVGNAKGRWRKKGKRGVSPIIATILLVAITVVLAAVLYILISGLTKGPGNTPLGTALAMAAPNEGTAGTGHWYNFSVQSAGGGLTLGSIQLQIQTPSGGIVTWPAGSTVNMVGLTGNTVGTYTTGTGVWTNSATAITSQMILVIYTAATSVSGDSLVVSGTGSFAGSIAVSIQ
jgi:flagellin-like protein